MRSVRNALKRFAGNDLDDAAENVGGAAVIPFRAGLAHQRQAGDQRGVFGIADLAAAQPRLLIQLLHQAVAGVVVGDARGVAQQILDRHRPLQRHEVELAVVLDADLLVGKFRDEFRDGIVEQEMAVLDQHHDADRDDRLGHREDAEDACRAPSARSAAGLCLPSASNQPIWPRRATITVAPGRVPLSISRLKASDIRCSRIGREPERFRFGLGSGGVCGAGAVLGGGLRGHGLSLLLLLVAWRKVWRRTPGLNRPVLPVNRFALAIGALPMLETARIGGDAGSLQECSSIGRAPVSKTGGRRFEPCHSCQLNQALDLDLWPARST